MAASDFNQNSGISVLPTDHVTYFIVKCNTAEDLETCIKTNRWACRKRLQPPQPQDLLYEAHRKGKVILIFSITKNHGWHGYCISESSSSVFDKQKNNSEKQATCSVNNDAASAEWDYFPVHWCVHFQDISKQACLPSAETLDLELLDGSSVNRARNWQQISERAGEKLCKLMSNLKEKLIKHKDCLLKKEEERAEPLLFVAEGPGIEAAKVQGSSIFEGWDLIINKVEQEFGKIHLVCPFGSQRYNCSMPDSDSDIFIVYQAKTTRVLGLNPPKPTVKNSHKAQVDYTILELHRYCQLLVAGDPRTVETLFLKPDQGVVNASKEWMELIAHREGLLSQACLEKYLREAQGTTGLKQLHKLHTQAKCTEKMSAKMAKLGYIVLRLLQNARDMCVQQNLCVFRPCGSDYQRELIDTRHARTGYTPFMALCHRYLDEIQTGRGSLPEETASDARQAVESWLISCRLHDLHLA